MPLLTREQILSHQDRKSELVSVPEWGGEVYVGVMTGAERDVFEAHCQKAAETQNYSNIRARHLSLTIVDEEGNRLFTDEDVEALAAKSCAALDRVFAVSQRLNRFSDADIEELAGNSSSGPGEDTA